LQSSPCAMDTPFTGKGFRWINKHNNVNNLRAQYNTEEQEEKEASHEVKDVTACLNVLGNVEMNVDCKINNEEGYEAINEGDDEEDYDELNNEQDYEDDYEVNNEASYDNEYDDEWADVPEEEIHDPSLVPLISGWHKPFDILIRTAIRASRCSNGVPRCDIIKHILCNNPQLKTQYTVKAVGKALKRMVSSGHLCRPCPGYFLLTQKGRSIQYRCGQKFDRTICGQKRMLQAAKARARRRSCNRRKKCPPKPCPRKRRRRCPPKPCPPRRRCPPKPCPRKRRRRCPPKPCPRKTRQPCAPKRIICRRKRRCCPRRPCPKRC